MSKQYDKEFKENAVRYYNEHEDLNLKRCATNLGIAASTLGDWVKKADINNGEVPTRGSGNYSSDEAKENAKLRKGKLQVEIEQKYNQEKLSIV